MLTLRSFRWLRLAAVFCALVWLFQGCSPKTENRERGNSPWVFRSVLDKKARMITLALAKDFWVSYDAAAGALYKVWKDGVNFEGPVYNHAHGPQPTAAGKAWIISPEGNPWVIVSAKGEQAPARFQYRGHRFEKGQALLQYELYLDDNTRIEVSERPEHFVREDKRPGLERVFVTRGVPEGMQVALNVQLDGLPNAGAWRVENGGFEVKRDSVWQAGTVNVTRLEGRLTLASNAETNFRCWFMQSPVRVDPSLLPAEGSVHPGLALIEKSDCKTCHNEQVKTVGPSYVQIAEKYSYTPVNLNMLAGKVMKGGSGVWGEVAMTAHPDLTREDAIKMMHYIMSLDGELPSTANTTWDTPSVPLSAEMAGNEGLAIQVYLFDESNALKALPVLSKDQKPVFSGAVPQIHATQESDFGPFSENFYLKGLGYIVAPQTGNYAIRLVSDDGSRLRVNGELLIENDGLHGPSPADAEVNLNEGKNRIELEYFQGGGGQMISLQWAPPGKGAFEVIPAANFSHDAGDIVSDIEPFVPPQLLSKAIPGDAYPLQDVHPAYDLSTIRPESFKPMVGGLDVFPDGRVAVSTWDPDGAVYILSNVNNGNPGKIKVQKVAEGLAEPLGLKIVDGEIYVLQKQELTQLIDHDKDGVIDEYRTLCNSWQVSANFHEFAFGLVYKDGYFYCTLATAILPGGASARPQIPDRGKAVKIARDGSSVEFIAHGLRTPNGIGLGVDNEIFITDNQGDWLPSCKVLHLTPGAFFGSRSVDFEGTANLSAKQPVVWLPQDEIGNSPGQPAPLNDGPYKGQMLHGEVTNGGLKRVFVEKVNGEYQGAVFHFSQGLEAGVNRLAWGADGALYIGGIGNPGNWGHIGKNWYGLQRMKYNGHTAFEILAMRAKSNGIELEFTEPIEPGKGMDPAAYIVRQWRYVPTAEYGGPKVDDKALPIRSLRMSADRRKVFLELDGMKAGHVVYVRIKNHFRSQSGRSLWISEGWYTLNQIPQGQPGFANAIQQGPQPDNSLSEAEKQAGWRLLFDGKSTAGWRNYGKQRIGPAWTVQDGSLSLDNSLKKGWQTYDGGDIVSEEVFENYELVLHWKVAPGGNSGIIYNVQESPKHDYPWQTGPEMQVLDNTQHPDGKIFKHRAGDLYDLIPCRFVAVNPAGEWNEARLVQQKGVVEHWLNGHLMLSYDMNKPEWIALIKGSKFKDMPDFGRVAKGRICLQDHGDRVWFKNIKIRPL